MYMAKKLQNEETGVAEGAQRATGDAPVANQTSGHPDPEVSDKPKRRRFTAEYKLKILHEAEQCTNQGEIGSLLRREGIYSSYLAAWRRERERGELHGLNPKKRGRKSKLKDERDDRIKQLERETRQLKKKLQQAEVIIDFQKKVSELLGIPLQSQENDEND